MKEFANVSLVWYAWTVIDGTYTLRGRMATIQQKISRGYKYWYIVESRRVNGKPRPIVLAYLGKAEDLLRRLQGLTGGLRLKSYSHGAVAALLNVSHKLNIPAIINSHIKSSRSYTAPKPIRNGLTAGITLLLGSIGRVCMPTSKRGWWNWAKTSTCEYLLRCSLSKIDSQHFWDLMDSLPAEAIPQIENEILKKTFEMYDLKSDSLFFDTTNFFTYIDSTNLRCTIAQRGKNKQKRNDLRQVGLGLVVTREDMIPLFHFTYRGNMHDTKVFRDVITNIKQRIERLGLDIRKHTIVYDRGNNSKINLGIIQNLGMNYVGALTPYHHKILINDAVNNFQDIRIDEDELMVYRDQRMIWGESRTVVVFISEKLKAGQIRGAYQSLQRAEKRLRQLQKELSQPKAKKRDREQLEEKITKMVKGQHIKNVINWSLIEIDDQKFYLDFLIDEEKLREMEESLGFRIIMTNRHSWSTEEIIKAYYGQSRVEHAFRNLKNPYHLTVRPQFHWTDQKIKVHYFICVIGYLLSSLVWREAKLKAGYCKSLESLLDDLNNIRLACVLEDTEKKGPLKAAYKLEEMDKQEKQIVEALEIEDLHNNRPKFKGLSVYNQNASQTRSE